MSTARIIAVAPNTPADSAGVAIGDDLVSINGSELRDIIEYQFATQEPIVDLVVSRNGIELDFLIEKPAGDSLGIEIDTPVFDRVRTCDNHCEFCFIYQLPKGMRRSLYLKDDDYRLSFLYGNFTTLTRFTEADLERVITERLSPLYVSIHATNPQVRADILKNPRGAMSLRWLRALLDHGVEVHGQVVVCPGVNDADVLEQTLCGILDEYPELVDVAVVPLGISKFNKEDRMRPHTRVEAERVCDLVDDFQQLFISTLGRPMVFASDEYYLMAERELPPESVYGDFSMHEDGIGMIRAFEAAFLGRADASISPHSGFFASVDGAVGSGYRAPRVTTHTDDQNSVQTAVPTASPISLSPRRRNRSQAILTGTYGSTIFGPLLGNDFPHVRVIEVPSTFFGGNVSVAGLMTFEDLSHVLGSEPEGDEYLLPDVCLSDGRFLDGGSPNELPRQVTIVETNGSALRRALR